MRDAALPEPERWSDRSTRATTAESAVGATLRRVRQATVPSEAALARVARRTRASSAAGRRSGARSLWWRVALAATLIMATGGFVGAARLIWRRIQVTAPADAPVAVVAAPPDVAQPRRGRRRAGASSEPPTEAPAPAAPAPAEPIAAPAEALAAAASPAPHAPPAALVAAPGAAGPRRAPRARVASAPPGEAETLAAAFRELRSGGDPAAALRSLDAHDRRFPAGPLRGEARIARAEALIALDRRSEALPLLDDIEDSSGALTRNVRLTRAELRAEAGRCAGAGRDFDLLLAATERDAAGARALYGRASCRLTAGEAALARADLRRYLELHPDGGFAAAARRALDSGR